MGKAISGAILNNPKEIKRRSESMKKMSDDQWSDQEYREKNVRVG